MWVLPECEISSDYVAWLEQQPVNCEPQDQLGMAINPREDFIEEVGFEGIVATMFSMAKLGRPCILQGCFYKVAGEGRPQRAYHAGNWPHVGDWPLGATLSHKEVEPACGQAIRWPGTGGDFGALPAPRVEPLLVRVRGA